MFYIWYNERTIDNAIMTSPNDVTGISRLYDIHHEFDNFNKFLADGHDSIIDYASGLKLDSFTDSRMDSMNIHLSYDSGNSVSYSVKIEFAIISDCYNMRFTKNYLSKLNFCKIYLTAEVHFNNYHPPIVTPTEPLLRNMDSHVRIPLNKFHSKSIYGIISDLNEAYNNKLRRSVENYKSVYELMKQYE